MDDGIIGLDLAGNEAEFPSQPFYGIFKEARQAGLHVTIHAGEWGPAQHIQEAIEELGADRIGHGVRVLENENITALAREKQIAFEVCITSNYQSGVIEKLEEHPLVKMFENGINVTINTDDPSISRITLSHEYYNACDTLQMPQFTLKERILAAAQAGFLPDNEKEKLVSKLKQDLKV
jgi:adenosine deaminase